jgi:hypothetical protein
MIVHTLVASVVDRLPSPINLPINLDHVLNGDTASGHSTSSTGARKYSAFNLAFLRDKETEIASI